jgi:alpha-tubulin suppressor-like RCC1 family protein
VGYPDNRAWCWGYNGSNAIGDGSTALYRPTPVTVSGTRQFRQVDVGQFHSCGVTTADRAFCWGYNQYGQLGDSSAIPSYRSTPTAVAGGHPFRQISAGQDVTCAVSTFNQAWCWGNGQNGQIGDGFTTRRRWPRAVAGGLKFTRVTVGLAHTCAEGTTKRAYCWGTNGNAQVGDGTTGGLRLKPVAVVGGLGFYQLSAGGFHTCGKTGSSKAYCWGTNFNGELGNGSTAQSPTPVAVAGWTP